MFADVGIKQFIPGVDIFVVVGSDERDDILAELFWFFGIDVGAVKHCFQQHAFHVFSRAFIFASFVLYYKVAKRVLVKGKQVFEAEFQRVFYSACYIEFIGRGYGIMLRMRYRCGDTTNEYVISIVSGTTLLFIIMEVTFPLLSNV